MKLFESMYNKICNSFQLYRADLESSKLFIENILKHFSKVFVLSKNLYLQAQNLQQLNYFLLSELNKWDRMEIDKNLQLEDIRAELEAEKKLMDGDMAGGLRPEHSHCNRSAGASAGNAAREPRSRRWTD